MKRIVGAVVGEGGFKIRLPETSEYGVDPDCKIAQLRSRTRMFGTKWAFFIERVYIFQGVKLVFNV